MKCSCCGAETHSSRCEYCNTAIKQPVSDVIQDITYNVRKNITENKNIIREPYTEVSRKSKSTAITLCCLGFFGLGGFHRFYTGKIGTGILWFLTLGCFGIGTIMDLVSIIINKFYDENDRRISRW